MITSKAWSRLCFCSRPPEIQRYMVPPPACPSGNCRGAGLGKEVVEKLKNLSVYPPVGEKLCGLWEGYRLPSPIGYPCSSCVGAPLQSALSQNGYGCEFLLTIGSFCLLLGVSAYYSEFLLTTRSFCLLLGIFDFSSEFLLSIINFCLPEPT